MFSRRVFSTLPRALCAGIWFKITNENEYHNDHQYQTGLNVLNKKFNDDAKKSCSPGGLYFTDIKNIFKFLNHGIYLREITLPTDDPEFMMIQDPDGDKWRANKIILGKRWSLCDPETLRFLLIPAEGNGTDVRNKNDAIIWAYHQNLLGNLEIAELFLKAGADSDYLAGFAFNKGNISLIEFLIKNNVDFQTFYQKRKDSCLGQLKQGCFLNDCNNSILRIAVWMGDEKMVELLIKNGMQSNPEILQIAQEKKYDHIHKLLLDN